MTVAAMTRGVAAKVTWDAARDAPQLFAVASEDVHALVARLRESVPIAPSIDPFDDDASVRPYRHLRAFYLRVPGGVVAIKGTEPYAPDLRMKLMGLRAFRVDYPPRGRSLFSALEHFPIVEQKVPLAVTAEEALSDVHAAAAFQQAHLAAFGTIAAAPLPLLALRWPADAVERVAELLLPMLSARAAAIVRLLLAQGFGCVVYHYPSVPSRVAHLDHDLGSPVDYPARRRALATRLDPARTIESWVDLAARMIVLGFLPGSTESHGIGHCLEAQNAVIDGGFVDLGSMKPIDQAADAREVEETLLAAVADLSRTIRQFLAGGLVDAEAEYRNPTLVMMHVAARVFRQLCERVALHASAAGVHPHVGAFFERRALFEDLDRGLALLHAPFSIGSDHR